MSSIPESRRQRVRARASRRCEYCGLPEGHSLHPFHVDHILSVKHGGTSKLDNLAWACFDCNVFKGSDIAGYDPDTGDLVPLYNPRSASWNTHFALDNRVIKGKTPVGRVTAEVLQFNRPGQIEIRQLLIEAGLYLPG